MWIACFAMQYTSSGYGTSRVNLKVFGKITKSFLQILISGITVPETFHVYCIAKQAIHMNLISLKIDF